MGDESLPVQSGGSFDFSPLNFIWKPKPSRVLIRCIALFRDWG